MQVTTRLSNLDADGKLVRKGALVTRDGFRYRVLKVRMGYAYAAPVDCWGSARSGATACLICERVRVLQ